MPDAEYQRARSHVNALRIKFERGAGRRHGVEHVTHRLLGEDPRTDEVVPEPRRREHVRERVFDARQREVLRFDRLTHEVRNRTEGLIHVVPDVVAHVRVQLTRAQDVSREQVGGEVFEPHERRLRERVTRFITSDARGVELLGERVGEPRRDRAHGRVEPLRERLGGGLVVALARGRHANPARFVEEVSVLVRHASSHERAVKRRRGLAHGVKVRLPERVCDEPLARHEVDAARLVDHAAIAREVVGVAQPLEHLARARVDAREVGAEALGRVRVQAVERLTERLGALRGVRGPHGGAVFVDHEHARGRVAHPTAERLGGMFGRR